MLNLRHVVRRHERGSAQFTSMSWAVASPPDSDSAALDFVGNIGGSLAHGVEEAGERADGEEDEGGGLGGGEDGAEAER